MRKLFHIVCLGGLTALIAFCLFYPYMPGEYDGLAETLSSMAQVFGVVGILLVPIGLLWLVHEIRIARRKPDLLYQYKGYYFAVASLVAGLFVAVAVSLIAWINIGLAFGALTLAFWLFIFSRLGRGLRRLKNAEDRDFNYAPLYLILLPTASLFLQLQVGGLAMESSRERAIGRSAELIDLIESYHATHGSYPDSLLALNRDFHTSVVGVEGYFYAPNGDAYNLFFQQPRFLFPELGAREIVMYNRLEEHTMPSHAFWILDGPPEELVNRQGWYAVHDAPVPHWKYFWFD